MSGLGRYANLPKQPVGRGPNGRPFCRRCQKEVGPGRRTWCSQACIDAYLVTSSATGARSACWKRDRGVCTVCKLDTHRLAGAIERAADRMDKWGRWDEWKSSRGIRRFLARDGQDRAIVSSMVLLRDRALEAHGYQGHHENTLWEADHIKPVKEGGGACGLDNLRTLCVPCHKRISALGARRRAIERMKARNGGGLFEMVPTEAEDLVLGRRRARRGRVPRERPPTPSWTATPKRATQLPLGS